MSTPEEEDSIERFPRQKRKNVYPNRTAQPFGKPAQPSTNFTVLHGNAEAVAIDFQKTVKKIASEISDLKAKSGDGLRRDDLETIFDEFKKAQDQASDISKHVIMPEDLNLKLVRADSLDRLDEYRSQESQILFMLGLLGGAALAIVVNWITSPDNVKTDLSIITLSILLVFCAYFGYRLWWTSQKTEKVRQKIFGDNE